MPVVTDTFLVIENCRRELEHLRKSAAEFRAAAELSRQFLTGAAKLQMQSPSIVSSPVADGALKLDPQIWREMAAQARDLAELTLEPEAKLGLLEVARTYDRLAG